MVGSILQRVTREPGSGLATRPWGGSSYRATLVSWVSQKHIPWLSGV